MNPFLRMSCPVLLSFLLLPCAFAQWKELPKTGSPTERLPDRTTLVGQAGLGPLMTAKLVDEHHNAKQKRAVVEVQTAGVELVPPSANLPPKLYYAYIQYRLDNGQAINTASERWVFDNLSPGEHRIQVTLAAMDNKPMGKQTTLKVRIP